jgi:chromosome segregation ATPase
MNKKIIETLKKEITNLKNIIDSKETDVERLDSINKEHKKLNGRLRLEINELNGSWKKYNETRNKLKKKKLISL